MGGPFLRVVRAGTATRSVLWMTGAAVVAACGGDTGNGGAFTVRPEDGACSIPESEILSGGPGKDGIPALTNPTMVSASAPGASYLRDDDRVIGLIVGDDALAVPLNILWWHEIVNLDHGTRLLAVTHCPLTGSSLAFDRAEAGGAEFGVSGLLFRNNLVMYDRNDAESLWPQLSRGARCGVRDGTDLTLYPIVETEWAAWRALYPGTRVVSSQTGHARDYQRYPYGDYDRIENSFTLFPVDIDPRRPAKERVLGIPGPSGGVAYPFGELARLGSIGIVHLGEIGPDEGPVVILWDSESETAVALRRLVDGTDLTFTVSEGRIVDAQTGSVWRIDGVATEGPLVGRRLAQVPEAYVAYWFAWAVFEPRTHIFGAQHETASRATQSGS